MQLPAGWLIDRFGTKKVYTLALIWWSGATMLTGAVSKMGSFIFARVLLGVGEAPCFPTMAKITSYWFPKRNGVWRQEFGIRPPNGALPLHRLCSYLSWLRLAGEPFFTSLEFLASYSPSDSTFFTKIRTKAAS